MILNITVEEITFWNGNSIYVIRNVSFTFYFILKMTLKKLLENALRFETDVVWLFCDVLSQFHLLGRTHVAGSVSRISFKYKLMGFRINFSKRVWEECYSCELGVASCRFLYSFWECSQDCKLVLLGVYCILFCLILKLNFFLILRIHKWRTSGKKPGT